MKRSRDRRSAGFTLLEITITLAIIGFVMIIVYGVFARTLAGKEYAESRAEETAVVRAAFARITRDLASVVTKGPTGPVPTPARGSTLPPQTLQRGLFLSRNHNDGGVPFDEIAFTAFVRRPAGLGVTATDVATVHYFAAPDPTNPRRRALLREAIPSLSGQAFDPESPNLANTVQLLDGIAGIEFRLFDGRDWVEEWDSTDPRTPAPFPQAVEIALAVWNEQGEAETFRTAVDLPIARGNLVPTQIGGATPSPTAEPSGEPPAKRQKK
jgi:prepilin-type N-terminal cleavage/methylation domain-containing protein